MNFFVYSDKNNMKISKMKKILTFILITLLGTFFLFADSSYIVKKGDTLYSISRKYQITVPELRAANNLSENDILKEGAKLIIPSADIENAVALSTKTSSKTEKKDTENKSQSYKTSTYTVQKGDTLYAIARKYGIKLNELLSLNNIDSSSTIKAGQKLLVPGEKTKTSVKQTTKSSEVKKPVTKDEDSMYKGVTWPLKNPIVKNISGKVSGVQLTGKENEAVTAVREGSVMYTGVYRGFGEVIFIQSKTGVIYSYSGLGKVSVKKGEYVLAGSEIGRTGRGEENSIKFMVFQNGKPINPALAPRG